MSYAGQNDPDIIGVGLCGIVRANPLPLDTVEAVALPYFANDFGFTTWVNVLSTADWFYGGGGPPLPYTIKTYDHDGGTLDDIPPVDPFPGPVLSASGIQQVPYQGEPATWGNNIIYGPPNLSMFAVLLTEDDMEPPIPILLADPPPTVWKICLGKSTEVTNNLGGAIYVPTEWSAKLTVTASAGQVELYYDNGADITTQNWAVVTAPGKKVANAASPLVYEVPYNKHGWYAVKLVGVAKTTVANTFVQTGCLSRMTNQDPNDDVWCSWWWPHDDNNDPNQYDNQVNYATGHGNEDGPLKKYDAYAGTPSPGGDSAQKYQKDNFAHIPGDGCSAGMCDAAAFAGFEVDRPAGDKTLKDPGNNNVVFREQDRIAMTAERHWIPNNGETDVDEPGTDYHVFRKQGTALHADWFHYKLYWRIYMGGEGVLVRINNWNRGVYKYEAAFVADGITDALKKQATITTTLYYRNVTKWTGAESSASTTYKLRFEDGGWFWIDGRGELSWSAAGKPDLVCYKKGNAPSLLNQKVDKTKLQDIYINP